MIHLYLAFTKQCAYTIKKKPLFSLLNLKVTVSTILSDFLDRIFSPKLEQMWVKIHLKQPKSGFHEIFRGKCVSKQFVSGLL